MSYTVALRYRADTPVYGGVITSMSFESKEVFNQWYSFEKGQVCLHELIEEGITLTRARQLVESTPVESRIRVEAAFAAGFRDAESCRALMH